MQIQTKRIYQPIGKKDGVRILVDRLWPRGVSKADAAIDLWLKELAPSDRLRKWYGHDPERWKNFRERYFSELDTGSKALEQLCELIHKRRVTLVFSARDESRNNAIALKEYLQQYC